MDKNILNLQSDVLILKPDYYDKEQHEENFQDNWTLLYLGYGGGYVTIGILSKLRAALCKE